jgi:RNA polymerase sigma-54 factor
MRQSLQLRLGQQLTMTPQLQQAIRLLQLSSLDLQTEIQQVLDSNLMLERTDEFQEYPPTSDTPPSGDNGEVSAEPEREAAADDSTAAETPVDSTWDDTDEFYDGATPFSRDDDDTRDPFEHRSAGSESLRDYLLWQMRLTPFSEDDSAIALAIIDAVDDAGYLSLSLEEIQQGLNDDLELGELEAVLHRIQRFDPPGVAARNPAECLLLQLEQLPPATPYLGKAQELVKHHLELLAGRDFTPLMRRLKVAREELQEIIALIQTLNPHPGTQISSAEPQYIAPDVFVYRHKNTWRVELNPESTPKLRINKQYSQLVRRADNSNDNLYLKNHLQEARWFLKSLRNRNETLLKVAICIVERQRDFLEHGEEHMRPLVLRDIAETMGMHESTISRVTTQKYMNTPRGIYEFKYFFSSHVGTNDGGECSSVAIRAMIKKLIAEESPRKPLSDNKIAELLGAKEGINVARRTVAKYREVMSIPSSTDRKRLT